MKHKPSTSGTPCPSDTCNSSDAFFIQDNGWGHCFSCGHNQPPDKGNKLNAISKDTNEVKKKRELTPLTEVHRAFASRGLTEETIKRYKINVGKEDDNYEAKYPLFDPNTGEHVSNKVRLPDKGFLIEGDFQKAGLFGRHAFPPGSATCITVVEGQDDAAAAYQIMGSK